MKNSKSEGWILQIVLLGNQYLCKSQCSVELSVALFCFCTGPHYINLEIAAVDFISVIAGLVIHNILKDSACREEQKVLWLWLQRKASLCHSRLENTSL